MDGKSADTAEFGTSLQTCGITIYRLGKLSAHPETEINAVCRVSDNRGTYQKLHFRSESCRERIGTVGNGSKRHFRTSDKRG